MSRPVRFSELRSVSHNIAASLASGCCLLIGMYEMDVFGEASRTPDRQLKVDFLSGTVFAKTVSDDLRRAVVLYRDVLPTLCERHGVPVAAFRQLQALYRWRRPESTFIVTIRDELDRHVADEYMWWGERPRSLDHLGRIRTRRPPVVQPGNSCVAGRNSG